MAESRFLLGRGELLTESIAAPKRGGEKKQVYTFKEALSRTGPKIRAASSFFDSLDEILCPNDYVISKVTLNPAYIAKSYFPSRFLRAADLIAVGSRNERITPEKWGKKGEPTESQTVSVFVAGQRSSFRSLSDRIGMWTEDSTEAKEFAQIEDFSVFVSEEKYKEDARRAGDLFEVGLHLLPGDEKDAVLMSFMAYIESIGGEVDDEHYFEVGRLWFIPVKIPRQAAPLIAQHSFVRVVRPMPKLRGLRPLTRSTDVELKVSLPDVNALSDEPRVAILDGGIPEQHPLGRWIDRYQKSDSEQESLDDGEKHGLGVTSAFLFGPLEVNEEGAQPFSKITCIRVLDALSNQDDSMELYRTLGFIEEILLSRQYQFINLSLGPDLPIDDDDVHAWTSVIDSVLEDGETLLTVAAGNNGEADRASGNARIQVPSDAVNAIGIGAADREDDSAWERSSYSAVGPGRRPGVIKPDLVAFGGSPKAYFHHIAPGPETVVLPQMGTSFSSPYALRTAVGIRAVLGRDISPLAIKALMVHTADQNGHSSDEVGWGKIASDIEDIVVCPDGVVRVVYQGELNAGKYLRARVPVPNEGIVGNVTMKATFCYASQVDPQDAASYTRSGLEVTFRPDLNRKSSTSEMPATRTFFNMDRYSPEGERRAEFGKWETVLHDEDRMRGSTLKAPVFDIHYNARESGGSTNAGSPIQYALVITIDAPKHSSLYNDVLEAYSEILVPLRTEIEVPTSV